MGKSDVKRLSPPSSSIYQSHPSHNCSVSCRTFMNKKKKGNCLMGTVLCTLTLPSGCWICYGTWLRSQLLDVWACNYWMDQVGGGKESLIELPNICIETGEMSWIQQMEPCLLNLTILNPLIFLTDLRHARGILQRFLKLCILFSMFNRRGNPPSCPCPPNVISLVPYGFHMIDYAL